MCGDEGLRIVAAMGLLFAAWFALVGWSPSREGGGRGWRFLGAMAGLCAGSLTLCFAASWAWSVAGR